MKKAMMATWSESEESFEEENEKEVANMCFMAIDELDELSFTEPPHIKIPPHQAPHGPNHAPWMDLSAQISSLGTRMKELAVVNDTRFYSMEDRMNRYQTGFTSQFEYL
ncbi:hypothetical protein VitviT2T_030111 [Vitis vinifera]|uniref:Uncharacterized protein n=1 Tax=Vitis vinifera TaxID=29760 RepID=A0ABY9DYH1_VITVI|nr:hypothetical protein VitviT2T_030111 [Vitis vinifera]